MEFASSLFRHAGSFLRRTTPLLALLATTTLAACGDDDDDDNGTGPGGGITGTWVLEEAGFTEYVRITSNTITVYEGENAAGCFFTLEFDIVDQDGDIYTLQFEGDPSSAFDVEIERAGDNLMIEGEIYEPSNVNVSNLDICPDPTGEFDPNLGSCTSLPTLALNGSVNGSLTTGDPADPNGFRYDQYRLQLGSTTDLELTLRSDEIDSFLYLYSSSGALLAADDDSGVGNTGFDSQIFDSFSSGCYIVVASSFSPGETGAYQLFATSF